MRLIWLNFMKKPFFRAWKVKNIHEPRRKKYFCSCVRPVKELFMHSFYKHIEGDEKEEDWENTCLHLTLANIGENIGGITRRIFFGKNNSLRFPSDFLMDSKENHLWSQYTHKSRASYENDFLYSCAPLTNIFTSCIILTHIKIKKSSKR